MEPTNASLAVDMLATVTGIGLFLAGYSHRDAAGKHSAFSALVALIGAAILWAVVQGFLQGCSIAALDMPNPGR